MTNLSFLKDINQQPSAGRYAPSPSGDLHLGNLRTALLAWAFARTEGRPFIIRVEDIDDYKTRDLGYKQVEDIKKLGIDFDGDIIWSSNRHNYYQEAIDFLTNQDLTYPCYCSRKDILEAPRAPHTPPGAYPQTCRNLSEQERAQRQQEKGRPPAIRIKGPNELSSITDRVFGKETALIDDFVLQRFDGTPAYNLTVVVDDALDSVGQICRGDDLLSSSPRQAWLAEQFGFPIPQYCHVPLVLNKEKKRLAKRDGAVTLDELEQEGVSIQKVINVLAASCGFNDVHSAQQFLEVFNVHNLSKEPWVYQAI